MIGAESAAEFAERSQRVQYRQGEGIAVQGEVVDRIGVIASGLVKVVMLGENGEEYLVQLLGKGQLIGATQNDPSPYAWEASSETAICWIQHQAWTEFLRERPEHVEACLAIITGQLEDARQTALRIRGRSTVQRVACWILEHAPNPRTPVGAEVRIELSRRDLALLLDMSAESLCRALHQLADRKAIVLRAPDLVEIADPVKLRVLAKWREDCAIRLRSRSAPIIAPPARNRAVGPGMTPPVNKDRQIILGKSSAR